MYDTPSRIEIVYINEAVNYFNKLLIITFYNIKPSFLGSKGA